MQHGLLISHATFIAYVVASTILCLNLLGLWVASGAARARDGIAINPEDGARYHVPVSELDPPNAARYLRAHRNAEATIYPFLVFGLLYVLAGGSVSIAAPIFALFVAARLAHTMVYLRAIQPWRTIAFATSLLAIIALIPAIFYVLSRA